MSTAILVPSIIGACGSARDSTRVLTTITLHADVSAEADFVGLMPPFVGEDGYNETVSLTGSVDKTWTRVPFPGVAGGRPSPGEGNFFVLDYGCGCCPCRATYVFDNDLAAINQDEDEGGEAINDIPLSMVASDDAPPPDPPGPTLVTFQIWPSKAPACRAPDGILPDPSRPPKLLCVVRLPTLPANHSYGSPSDPTHDLTFTVSGNNGAVVDGRDTDGPGSVIVGFTEPKPCDLSQSYNATVVSSNSFTGSDGNAQTVEVTTTFLLIIGDVGANAGMSGGYDMSQASNATDVLSTGGLSTGGLVVSTIQTGPTTSGTITSGALSLGGLSTSGGLGVGGLSTGGLDDEF